MDSSAFGAPGTGLPPHPYGDGGPRTVADHPALPYPVGGPQRTAAHPPLPYGAQGPRSNP